MGFPGCYYYRYTNVISKKTFSPRSCHIFMLFKWASQDLRPFLHQQMKFNPALHKLRTAVCPTSPSKHHTQHHKQPSRPARNLPQKRPAALTRSRSKQDGSGSPTPSLFPEGRRSPEEAPPPRAKPGPASSVRAGAGAGAGGRRLRSLGTHPGPLSATGDGTGDRRGRPRSGGRASQVPQVN